MELSYAYWMLHNLATEEPTPAISLVFDVDAFGDNGVDMFDYYLGSNAWSLPAWAVRLAVELAAAGGHEPEQNPIRRYFEAGGAQWPELGPREDSAEGIAWAATGVRESREKATVRFVIHPDWLPAQTMSSFRSWG